MYISTQHSSLKVYWTYISKTITMLDLSSKASTHCTSLGWWRLFMMPISCRTLSFSFCEKALMNFPAHTFLVDFSTSLKTWPNLPLTEKRQRQKVERSAEGRETDFFFFGEECNYVLRPQAILYVIELFNSTVFLYDHIPILRLFIWIWRIGRRRNSWDGSLKGFNVSWKSKQINWRTDILAGLRTIICSLCLFFFFFYGWKLVQTLMHIPSSIIMNEAAIQCFNSTIKHLKQVSPSHLAPLVLPQWQVLTRRWVHQCHTC